MGIGAAILGAGALTAVGGVISSSNQASAAKKAAQTQVDAQMAALAQQKETTQQVLGLEKPFVDMGTSAIPAYQQLLGIGPDGKFSPSTISSALAQTPGYQFSLDQGLKAMQNGYAAQGLARSGAAMKGAGQYAEGLASTQYQNILGNYYNAVAMGGNAAANFGASALGGQAAANQLITGSGQAAASGIVGAANANAAGLNAAFGGAGNALTGYALMNGGLFSSPSASSMTNWAYPSGMVG